MELVKTNRQRGQILVHVAIMMVALFAFVALALDVGHVYAGRRRMQNAADAGALAGAREICHGGYETIAAAHTEAEAAAIEYARDHNGAQVATVSFPDDYTVAVSATQTLDTFFAGVIGIREANVSARATARCSGTSGAGGVWPLGFRMDIYTDNDRIPCGEEFLVFSADDESVCAPEECCDCENNELCEPLTEWCEEEGYDSFSSDCASMGDCPLIGAHIDTDGRGWLLFPDPEDPYPFPDECQAAAGGPCGNPRVGCWLKYDYPARIDTGDCVPGKSGVSGSNAVVSGVEYRRDYDPFVEIILWDRECYDGSANSEDDPPALGPCAEGEGTDIYHVGGFGCIEVIDWERNLHIPRCSGSGTIQVAAIQAKKICGEDENPMPEECGGGAGTGSAELPQEWETPRVSLIE